MKKLLIILDSDGILCDPVIKLLKLYNSEYQLNLKKSDIIDYNLNEFQKPGTSITKYFNMPGFFIDVPVIKDAPLYVKKLIDDGHDVIIATQSSKSGIIDKYNFFEEYFPFVNYNNIIPISRKDLLHGDVIFEDCPDNLKTSRCRHKVVLNSPWNRSMDDKSISGLKRVLGWKEFYEYICYLSSLPD